MQIPSRPKELSTTLPIHLSDPEVEPPLFVYRFPTPEDEVESFDSLVSDLFAADPEFREQVQGVEDPGERAKMVQARIAEGRGRSRRLCQLFDRQIVRIENLQIDDEPFDPAKHLGQIPGSWKMAVAREINARVDSYLSELEVGNSSSPSSSAGTPTASQDMDDVQAGDAD